MAEVQGWSVAFSRAGVLQAIAFRGLFAPAQVQSQTTENDRLRHLFQFSYFQDTPLARQKFLSWEQGRCQRRQAN